MGKEPEQLEIPAFLKRDDSTNRAEFMSMAESVEVQKESRPAKTPAKAKANGAEKPASKAQAKGAAKPVKAAKTAPKATAKPAKAPEKAKAAKPKADKAEKAQFGLRKGSAKSDAAAMYARKSGATLEEVKDRVGSIQLNVLKGLEAEGFVVEKEKEAREGARAVTRYFLKAKG